MAKQHDKTAQPPANTNTPDPIVIVGGGFAGTTLLIHTLLQIARDPEITEPVNIVMVERAKKNMHGGVAYGGTPNFEHNLNLSGKRITPFKQGRMPKGFPTFIEYVLKKDIEQPGMRKNLQNVSRKLYGEYLRHLTTLALEKAKKKANVSFVYKNVKNLVEKGSEATLYMTDKSTLKASSVVLTTGFSEMLVPVFAKAVQNSDHFLDSPYSDKANQAFRELDMESRHTKVLIIGTGLTSFDTAARLLHSGYQGKITMMSRHNEMHAVYGATSDLRYLQDKLPGEPRKEKDMDFTKREPWFMQADTPEELINLVKEEFGYLQSQDITSEEILQHWERYVPDVCEKFTHQEIRQLLSSFGSVITANRVGVTPEIGNYVMGAIEAGLIDVRSAKIHTMQEKDDQIVCGVESQEHSLFSLNFLLGKTRKEKFDLVVSGMGNNPNFDRPITDIQDPLWKNLLFAGAATPHWTGIGVRVSKKFSMVANDGRTSQRVAVLGVPAAGHMMTTKYAYAEKEGSGGRLSPFIMNIPGITSGIDAFLDAKYEKLTMPFKQASAKNKTCEPVHVDKLLLREIPHKAAANNGTTRKRNHG